MHYFQRAKLLSVKENWIKNFATYDGIRIFYLLIFLFKYKINQIMGYRQDQKEVLQVCILLNSLNMN